MTKTWLSGSPASNPKSNPKSDFLTRKSHFWVTFGMADPESHFLVSFGRLPIFRGFGDSRRLAVFHVWWMVFRLIDRGAPQAYVRARASSATLCSVLLLKVFLCIFQYQKGNLIRIETGLDTYLIRIQTRTSLSRYPPYDYSKVLSTNFSSLDFVKEFRRLLS